MNVVDRPATLKNTTMPPKENQDTPQQQVTDKPPSRRKWRLGLYALLGLVVLGGGGYAGWQYWTVWQFEQSTDDAYVQADIIPIAPQVSGYIVSLLVNDNQPVKAGDVLATIDPRGYQDAVNQAKADVAEAEADITAIAAQLDEQNAVINEAEATVATDQASNTFAQENKQRFGTLEKSGSGSKQEAQQAEAQANSSQAIVTRDQAALEAAKKQVATLNAQLTEAQDTLEHNRAVYAQAQLNLGYTVLRAPVDGVVGSRTVRVGLYVQPGTELLAVVPLQAAYVVANYKETQLANVKAGQPVDIVVDAFAGTKVRGIVNSIAPASGQEFSLLPPDNATGNFTKIVQRVPIKITIDRTDPLAGRLLPGMSVTTTIKVGGQPQQPRPSQIRR